MSPHDTWGDSRGAEHRAREAPATPLAPPMRPTQLPFVSTLSTLNAVANTVLPGTLRTLSPSRFRSLSVEVEAYNSIHRRATNTLL